MIINKPEKLSAEDLQHAIDAVTNWEFVRHDPDRDISRNWYYVDQAGDNHHWPANECVLQYARREGYEQHLCLGTYYEFVDGERSEHAVNAADTYFNLLDDLTTKLLDSSVEGRGSAGRRLSASANYAEWLQHPYGRKVIMRLWGEELERLDKNEKRNNKRS